MGLGTNPPPQLGHTLSTTESTQVAQKVHSYVQMRASFELGGKGVLQCSQDGLSSSMCRKSSVLWIGAAKQVFRLILDAVRPIGNLFDWRE